MPEETCHVKFLVGMASVCGARECDFVFGDGRVPQFVHRAEAFDDLVGDRFLIGSPEEVAEQIVGLGRRLGVNHLVMSIQWAGMPHALVLDTMRMLAEQVFPKVREALGPVRTDRPGTG